MTNERPRPQSDAKSGTGLAPVVRRLLAYIGIGRRQAGPQLGSAFTAAFVALAAKMAKADGVAVDVEAAAFERFLEVPPKDLVRVRRLYDLAKQDTAGFDVYAELIADMLDDAPDIKRNVLEGLVYIACADGVLHPAEDHFLHEVARHFGYDEAGWLALRATFVDDPGSPYAVLGISPQSSDREVKARYRALAAELHPDQIAASGAQAAVVKAASAKMAHINAAYDAILSERRRRQP